PLHLHSFPTRRSSDLAQRFLLIDVRFIEHSDVNDDLARLAPRLRLKAHSQPAVRFVVLLEAACRDGIGENKKLSLLTQLLIEARSEEHTSELQSRGHL